MRKQQVKIPQLGDRHWIDLGDDGKVECTVRYINAGMAWLWPNSEVEHANGRSTLPCCAIAKIQRDGKIIRL